MNTERLAAVARQATAFCGEMASEHYDIVIDALGLFKSALVALDARGRKAGFSRNSLRQKLAALAYHDRFDVPLDIGIIERNRRLFAAAFNYALPNDEPDFAIVPKDFTPARIGSACVLFNHAASWPTKLWAVEKWRSLVALADEQDLTVCLPWFSEAERRTAIQIVVGSYHVREMQTDFNAMGVLIRDAAAVISVETGFAHLAASLGRPTVTLYGPSGVKRHATCGPFVAHQVSNLDCAPCYSRRCALLDGKPGPAPRLSELDSQQVWNAASLLMADDARDNRPQHSTIDQAKA